MNARKILWLLLFLSFAGFFILLLRLLNPAEEVVVEVAPEPVPVVAPQVDNKPIWVLASSKALPAAHKISLNDLKWVPISQNEANGLIDYTEKGSVDISTFKGSVLNQAVKDGELIPPHMLLKYGDAGFLALQLSPGKRALSLPIFKHAAQAALLSPGDEVDVIISVEKIISRNENKDLTAERSVVVASKSRVLAINRYAEGATEGEETENQKKEISDSRKKEVIVTLEVDPSESARLTLAGTLTDDIRLALRRPDDQKRTYRTVRASDLLSDMKSLQPESATVLIRGKELNIIGGM